VKRILVSILLLITALLISKPFAAELNTFSKPATDNSDSQTNSFEQNGTSPIQLAAVGCPCDTSPPNPTFTLVLTAAVTASLVMASFIYGSHFIVSWVTD
jgi:hypothetical protein